jgi:hypothetical protein
MLLDERLISALLSSSGAEVFEISEVNNNILISDGFSNISFQKEDTTIFPKAPEESDDRVTSFLNKDVIDSLSIAKSFAKPRSIEHPLEFVHMKPNEVFASDGFVMYHKKFDCELPTLMLYPETCIALAGYENVMYYRAGNYDFFESGNTKYGFIKTEAKPQAYDFIIDSASKKGGFKIDKDYIEKFCELTNNSTVSSLPISRITDAGINRLLFQFDDDNYGISTKMEFEVENKNETVPEYSFNPKILLPAIKSIPYDYLNLTPHKTFGYVLSNDEDENYTGIIMPCLQN